MNYFPVISTITIIIPLGLTLFLFKKADILLRFFCFYLILGFITDVFGWYKHSFNHIPHKTDLIIGLLYELYPPLEACFFIFFIIYFTKNTLLQKIAKKGLICIFPLWLVLHFFIPAIFPLLKFSFFDAVYGISIAVLACLVLLKLVERQDKPTKQTVFWILIGIFFYNFSTFFIMIFKVTELGKELWFLHNSINILTYLVYTFGLLIEFKKKPFPQNA